MKKHRTTAGLRPEYDFYRLKGVVRGKYAARYQAGTNLVHLEPDVAKVFDDDESVNQALRLLIRLAQAQAVPHTNRIHKVLAQQQIERIRND